MSMLLRKASSMNTARIEKHIDNKLNDQFRYFRREFMEAASAQGVTMPLELVEDKSGRFFTFVNANGPRYLLQIIHSQPEASTIMRCAISLLIVTMAILRRKLPENRGKTPGTNWMSLLSGNINGWATQILSTISDGASVSICINLLAKSKILVIRELVLSLLALLVNTSEEAVIQMVTLPNHQQISAKEMEERFRKENPHVNPSYKLTIEDKIGFNPSSSHGSCLAVMFALVADNRNHFTIVSACAEVIIAMMQHKSARIAQIIAQTSLQGPPPKEKKESEQKTLLKTVLNPKSNSNSQHKPMSAAKRASSADYRKRPPSRGGEEGGVAEAIAPEQTAKLAEHATWDAIHILIQFLQRFFRYTDVAIHDQAWNSMSAGDRKRLVQAHNRIVVAVSSMIVIAPDIGYYICQMAKARQIVTTSAKFYLSSNFSPPGGLPVKDRGYAVTTVSGAVEVLSQEYQSNFLRNGPSGQRNVTTPASLSRANSKSMSAFIETATSDDGGGSPPASPGKSSPGLSGANSSRGSSRGKRPTSFERSEVRKESMLPVVRVASYNAGKQTSPKRNSKKKTGPPQNGTNSLVEYAHLFSEGSDWVSVDDKSTLAEADASVHQDRVPPEETVDDFERKLREAYAEGKRKEEKKFIRERALSGRVLAEDSTLWKEEGRRPNTAPVNATTVCEFFQFMPPSPSLPRRLTAMDVSSTRHTDSAARNVDLKKSQFSAASPGSQSWAFESFASTKPSTAAGGQSRKQSTTYKILEGAISTYGARPKRSKSGRTENRRNKAGAHPSTSSVRLERASEEIKQADDSHSYTQLDEVTEDVNTEHRRNISTTNVKLDGLGLPEAIPPMRQSSRPNTSSFYDRSQPDPHSSLFLSVADGGHENRLLVSKEPDDNLNINAGSAEQTDQPSMWVSEVDKDSVYQIDGSCNPNGESRSNIADDGVMSRMLIADIINSFDDQQG